MVAFARGDQRILNGGHLGADRQRQLGIRRRRQGDGQILAVQRQLEAQGEVVRDHRGAAVLQGPGSGGPLP